MRHVLHCILCTVYWSTYFVKNVHTVCIATVLCWPICEVVNVNKKKRFDVQN